jgi:cobalamin synthase
MSLHFDLTDRDLAVERDLRTLAAGVLAIFAGLLLLSALLVSWLLLSGPALATLHGHAVESASLLTARSSPSAAPQPEPMSASVRSVPGAPALTQLYLLLEPLTGRTPICSSPLLYLRTSTSPHESPPHP